nr:putative ribonuclease H-like domain-containing protein [Tanacetum cinerariifolium]
MSLEIMGNPHQDLKDKGVIDSGCSRHMAGKKNPILQIMKKLMEDLLPLEELKFNLFSVSQICYKKNTVLFTDIACVLLSLDFKLTDKSHVLLKVPRKDNMYNVDLKNVVPQGGLTCFFAKATLDESNLWHRRLGHKGKQHKASCKTKTVSSISQPLQMLHMDLFGLTFIKSLMKKMYCLVVTDDFSREEEKKDAENPRNYDSEVLSIEEPRVNQEKDANVNNTNNINIVSPTNNAAGIKDNSVDENIIYGCADDPNMPGLEEISKFSDAENDDSWANMNNLDTYIQMDVKSAFLYGKIKKEVYVCQPPGFEDLDFPDKVYKVKKALYGLHQAPRAWYETLSTYLLDNGFQRGIIDKTLFIKRDKSDILLVQVYVDDIVFGSTRKEICTEFEKMMHKKFWMSSMGELTFFLGLQTASMPMETHKTMLKDEKGENVDEHLYRSMIGSLMYLTSSWPDIMFAIHIEIESTIFIVKNPIFHSKTKHIEIRHHFIRDSNEKKLIQMIKIHTDKNIANFLTKAFDATANVKNINRVAQLHTKVDRKKVVISKASIKRDLWFGDEGGINCLPNETIFEQLSLMGYEKLTQKLTFYKALFSSQWKFLIYTVIQCLNGKTTAWNEFSSTIASAVICLAIDQKFNFSKYIFDSMDTELPQTSVPIETIANKAINEEMYDSLERATTTATSLDAEHDRGNISKTQSKATPNEPSSPGTSSGGGLRRQDTIWDIISQTRVLNLETTKTAQAKEIANLKKRVKRLERKRKLRSHRLKRLYKVGLSARVESSTDEESLGEEDSSKQGMISDIDANQDIYLVNFHRDEDIFNVNDQDDTLMFDADMDLQGEEVVVVEEVNATSIATTTTVATTPTISMDEITLAKAKVDADYQLAERLHAEEQEQFTDAKKAKLFMDFMKKIRKFFAAKMDGERRKKPPNKAQQRSIMTIYLKNMDGWKPRDLKNKFFATIKKLFDKAMERTNNFVDFRTELVEKSKKKAQAEIAQKSSS